MSEKVVIPGNDISMLPTVPDIVVERISDSEFKATADNFTANLTSSHGLANIVIVKDGEKIMEMLLPSNTTIEQDYMWATISAVIWSFWRADKLKEL